MKNLITWLKESGWTDYIGAEQFPSLALFLLDLMLVAYISIQAVDFVSV